MQFLLLLRPAIGRSGLSPASLFPSYLGIGLYAAGATRRGDFRAHRCLPTLYIVSQVEVAGK